MLIFVREKAISLETFPRPDLLSVWRCQTLSVAQGHPEALTASAKGERKKQKKKENEEIRERNGGKNDITLT